MAVVDRDLEAIAEFCKRFEENLQKIEEKAHTLKDLGGKIESALYNTKFATDASGTVAETARKVLGAVWQGEQRIRQIERRIEMQIEERDRFEGRGGR